MYIGRLLSSDPVEEIVDQVSCCGRDSVETRARLLIILFLLLQSIREEEEFSKVEAEEETGAFGSRLNEMNSLKVADKLVQRGLTIFLEEPKTSSFLWTKALDRLEYLTNDHRIPSAHNSSLLTSFQSKQPVLWAEAVLRRSRILALLALEARNRGTSAVRLASKLCQKKPSK